MNGEKEKTGATASTTAVGRRAEELALRFLQAKGYRRLAQNARFDVLEVYLKSGEVRHIQNAFDAEA